MQISTFVVNQELFAIPSLQVEEFFRPMPVTRVYGADPRIDGLVNIRGRTAVVINMRRCLGITTPADGASQEMILLEMASGLVAEAKEIGLYAFDEPLVLSVDCIASIRMLESLEMHPPPSNVSKSFVDGVVETDGNYFTMISIKKLVSEIINGKQEVMR